MVEPIEEEKLHEDGLIGHLRDLRSSVVKSLVALVVVFIGLFPFSEQIYELFADPLLAELPASSALIATGVLAPFLVPLKVTLFVAFCICMPFMLYQLWLFVAPGLYRRERRFVVPLVFSSTCLFFVGVAFAYFLVFRIVFGFIVSIAPSSVSVMPDVQSHLSFALTIFLTFGLAFEVPVAVFLLVRMGVLELAALRRARPYVLVGSFVVAAIITPPDVFSQVLLALPVWLLYEIGIWISARLIKPDDENEQSEDA